MLIIDSEIHPSFGIMSRDQEPLRVYTVLSINTAVGDCAAYRGIGPMDADAAMIERIKAGGFKISEREARSLFDEIEDMALRYRP
jgi:hypothetical protein